MKQTKQNNKVFKFKPFSLKQNKVLTWWRDGSPYKYHNGIIADGSIRSGKTVSMSLSFIFWSYEMFSECNFGMCGKTIGSFKRNVWIWLKVRLIFRGFKIKKCTDIGENVFYISKNGNGNYYYIFGGKDERSQDLIQGITLAGILFDEVALMPESFINQATGRCSVDGSKFWFNCNPDSPYHYFKTNWIDKAIEKKLLYLHFTMDDNLSLTNDVKIRYCSMYVGVFYKRYILGLWVIAEGIIYDMFDEDKHLVDTSKIDGFEEYYVSLDYGTKAAFSAGLWGRKTYFIDGKRKKIWYRIREYYYSGKKEGKSKDDETYYHDLDKFIGDVHEQVRCIIIDPSASSFIATIQKHRKYKYMLADNDVIDGVRFTAIALNTGVIKFDKSCINTIREIYTYSWDNRSQETEEKDKVKKVNDHAMDDLRYFVMAVVVKTSDSKNLKGIKNTNKQSCGITDNDNAARSYNY